MSSINSIISSGLTPRLLLEFILGFADCIFSFIVDESGLIKSNDRFNHSKLEVKHSALIEVSDKYFLEIHKCREADSKSSI